MKLNHPWSDKLHQSYTVIIDDLCRKKLKNNEKKARNCFVSTRVEKLWAVEERFNGRAFLKNVFYPFTIFSTLISYYLLNRDWVLRYVNRKKSLLFTALRGEHLLVFNAIESIKQSSWDHNWSLSYSDDVAFFTCWRLAFESFTRL